MDNSELRHAGVDGHLVGRRLYESQLGPASAADPGVEFDGAAMMAAFGEALAGATGRQDARARIGALALRATTVPEGERRAIIRSRIRESDWPARKLVVTAVDTADGSFHALDAASGVPLVDAVAASCAVPGVWPPITVDGHRYMDGGMRSTTNADLAAGHDRVLVLAPMTGPAGSPLGPGLDEELEILRRHGDVHVVRADEAATRAFGTNPLDPATREPSARAGRQQADAELAPLRAFWG